MADNITTNDGGGTFLGFVVGGLLVVVLILGALFYNGNLGGADSGKTTINLEAPKVSAPATPAPAPTR